MQDVTGERHHRLVVLGDDFIRKRKRYVRTRCDCGTVKTVALWMMRDGQIKSCGCLQRELRERQKAKTSVGNRHHSWTIIADSDRRTVKGELYAFARCECGTEREVLVKYIRNGTQPHCGCRRVEFAPLEKLHKAHIAARDMIGQTAGELTVIDIANELDGDGRPMLMAECSCGHVGAVPVARVAGKLLPHCGGDAHLAAYGMAGGTLYECHRNMIRRCYDETFTVFHKYGATGVRVCDRWRFGEDGKTGFQCFLEDMGERPTAKHSIDRIDSWGDYEPGNCRWATMAEQHANRRPNGSLKALRRLVKAKGIDAARRVSSVDDLKRAGVW